MAAFHRPRTLADAIGLLAQEPAARPLGGGTAIQILCRQGLFAPPLLVDLAPLPELQGITEHDGHLRIGAMTTLRQVEQSPLVATLAPLLCQTYRRVGNIRIRHVATVGGNLAHADYRLDPPAALLALDASLTLAGPHGTRTLPLVDFFVDLLETALEPAELITDLRIPFAHPQRSTAFERFSSLAANDWPCVAVAACLDWAAPGQVRSARLGITAMAATPLRIDLPDVAGADEWSLAAAAVDHTLAVVDPLADLRGSVAYKRAACAALVRDAISHAWRAEPEAARSA